MEYLPYGNLWEVACHPAVHVTSLLRLRMCTEVANGLAFAHKLPDGTSIVHGELNEGNVLLTEDLHCKVSDFCNGRLFSGEKTAELNQVKNQIKQVFIAPELLNDPAAKMSPCHDVYSFAILVYEVATRNRPVEDYTLLDMYLMNVKEGNESAHPNLCSLYEEIECGTENDIIIYNAFLEIIKKSWVYDASKRPNMEEIKTKLSSLLLSYKNSDIVADVVTALRDLGDVASITKDVSYSTLSCSGSKLSSGKLNS